MLNLLDPWFKMPFGDAAFYAIFGFLFVFAGIVILILIFTLLGLVMKKIGNRKPRPRKDKKSKSTAEGTKAATAEDGSELSPELVAVITAAVAACLESEQSACDFVVRRIKKL